MPSVLSSIVLCICKYSLNLLSVWGSDITSLIFFGEPPYPFDE